MFLVGEFEEVRHLIGAQIIAVAVELSLDLSEQDPLEKLESAGDFRIDVDLHSQQDMEIIALCAIDRRTAVDIGAVRQAEIPTAPPHSNLHDTDQV